MTVECNGHLYYLEKEVKEIDKAYFYGCGKPRSMVTKKQIPESEYVFAIQAKKTGVWEIKNREYKVAKLLISKTWVDQNVPSLCRSVDSPVGSNNIHMAPVLLHLEDREKFRDAEGNILDIEVRGERDPKKCFFLVQDVSSKFGIPNLRKTLIHKDCNYREGDDFTYFIRSDDENHVLSSNKNMMFLTYEGLIKTLYTSRSPFARHFREWATEKLFKIQMGTQEQKEGIASDLLGVPVETVWKFLSACIRDIPMVYMLHLGKVPDSIILEGDRNDFLLFKIGQHGKEDTKNGFRGRSKGHLQEFKEFRHEMSYLHFVFLDPMYVSESETCIKEYFKMFQIHYEGKKEIYVIPKSKLKEIHTFFKNLSVTYSGNHVDIQRTWDQFRNETQARIHDLEVENQHLKCTLEQKESYYKTLIEVLTTKTQHIIESLQDRVTEQANTIRAFLSRMSFQ